MSDYTVCEETVGDYTVRVVYERDPVNPREEYDQVGTIAMRDSRNHRVADCEDFLIKLCDSDTQDRIERCNTILDEVEGRSYWAWNRQVPLEGYLNADEQAEFQACSDIYEAIRSGIGRDTIIALLNERDPGLALQIETWSTDKFFQKKHQLIQTSVSRYALQFERRVEYVKAIRRQALVDGLSSYFIFELHERQDGSVYTSAVDFGDPTCGGYIYVTKEDASERLGYPLGSPELEHHGPLSLKGEIETWSAYITGEVFGFIVSDDEDDHIESCWGFYNADEALSEGKSVAEYLMTKVAA